MTRLPDLERIRFVTQRSRQLRGLHLVAWSGPMSVYAAVQLLTGATQDALQGFVFVLAVCVPAGFAQAYLRGFYARRFGRLGSDDEGLSWEGLMLVAIGLAVLMSLIERIPTERIVPVFFVGFGIGAACVTVRDFRFRRYYVLGVCGALGALGSFWMTPSPTIQSYLAAVLVFHVGLTIVGLLDHWLLVHALAGPRHAEEEQTGG